MADVTFAAFADALARTESNRDAHAWGDQGRACGAWQMHPDFVDTYYPNDAVFVGMTWQQFFFAVLRTFWVAHVDGDTGTRAGAVALAMRFHLGGRAFERGDKDEVYEARFRVALGVVAGQ